MKVFKSHFVVLFLIILALFIVQCSDDEEAPVMDIHKVLMTGTTGGGGSSPIYYWHKITGTDGSKGSNIICLGSTAEAFRNDTNSTIEFTNDIIAGEYFTIVSDGGCDTITRNFYFYDTNDNVICSSTITTNGTMMTRLDTWFPTDQYLEFYYTGKEVVLNVITIP